MTLSLNYFCFRLQESRLAANAGDAIWVHGASSHSKAEGGLGTVAVLNNAILHNAVRGRGGCVWAGGCGWLYGSWTRVYSTSSDYFP